MNKAEPGPSKSVVMRNVLDQAHPGIYNLRC